MLLVLAVTAPAMVLVGLLVLQAYQNEHAAVTRHLSATARALAALVDQRIDHYETIAKGLANSPELEKGDFAAVDARARQLTAGTNRWVVVTDAKGRRVVNTRIPLGPPFPEVDVDGAALAAAQRGETYVSPLEVGAASKTLRMFVAVPVSADGRLNYVVSIVVPPSDFSAALGIGKIVPGNVVSIVDHTGTIVARSLGQEYFVGRKATPDMVVAVTTRAHGVVDSVTLEKIRVLAAFERAPRSGYAALIGAPYEELYASARRLFWVGGAVSAALLFVAFFVASWIGQAVVHSIDGLVHDADRIGRGEVPSPRPDRLSETGTVASAMRNTAEKLAEKVRDNNRLYAALQLELEEQKRLDHNSRRLAAIVESSGDAIISKSLEGIIMTWNAGAERILGYTVDEIVGQPITKLIPHDRLAEEPRILDAIRRGERIDHFETVRQRKDGSLVPISLSVSPIKNSAGQIIGASKIGRDISVRRQYERQRQALFELMEAVNRATDLAQINAAAIDAIKQSLSADRAAILLFDADKVMRFKASDGLSEEYRKAVEGHSPWKIDDTNAHSIGIDDVANASFDDGLRRAIQAEGIRALAFIPISFEGRLLGKFMAYYNQAQRFTPLLLRPAEAIAAQVAFAIERRRGAELLESLVNERTASLREAIEQMQEFSYSMSHDLRSPLRGMRGYAQALLEDHGESLNNEGRELLGRIVNAGERMDQMIQDLLTYSRVSRREMPMTPVSIDKLVSELRYQYPELNTSRVNFQIKGDLGRVFAHEPSLTQVLANLLGNAVKFVAPGTRPEVMLHTETRGDRLRLWVKDNGIGIKPEYQKRLFGLFERIHPEKHFEGTGIGLAIVRKAVERMNGSVGMESDGVSGSRFWIELPKAGS